MSGQPIDIRPDHEALVRDILVTRLPEGVRVWAFGSRAKWLAKPYSDLDLALEAAEPLPDDLVADLKDDFTESDLPWKVDVLDLNAIAPSFRKLIDKDKVGFSLKGKWRRCTLGGLVDFNPRTPVAKGESAPFVDMASLPTGDKFFPIADVREFKGSGSKFKDDDTLLARITPCLENGKGGFVQGLGESVSAHGSTEFIVLRAKTPSDKDFAYYITKHPDFRAFAIKQMSGTSGRQRVSWQSLTDYELHDLLPEEREEIGNLLGSLDDKMEGREPYLAPEIWELFPDRLGGDGLPVGWEMGTLADIAASARQGVRPSNVAEDTPYIGLEHMPRHSIALSEWAGAGKVSSNKSHFRRGEFLFGKLRPYFHKAGVAAIDGICSTDIVVVKPKAKEWAALILSCLSSDSFVYYTNSGSTGTKMPRTNWKSMGAYKLCLPPCDVAQVFEKMVSPMIGKIIANIHQSRTLAQTRDLLLPKLMSGEIRMREAEHLVEDAG